jgi:hypothetical protein
MLELVLLLSRYHQEHSLVLDFDRRTSRLEYEPGESCSGLFGGNSNWQGPIWFPLNFLAIESLSHLHAFFGEDLTVELPTGSGKKVNLNQVSTELERRLLSLFLLDPNGRRTAPTPVFKTTPSGGTRSSSMNTSTARPERVSAPRIRLAGQPSRGRSWRTGAIACRPNRKPEPARDGGGRIRLGTIPPVPSSSQDGRGFAPAV